MSKEEQESNQSACYLLTFNTVAPPTAVGWRFAIEHTVPPQSDQQSTGLVPQGPQEAMIALAAIPNEDVKATSQLT